MDIIGLSSWWRDINYIILRAVIIMCTGYLLFYEHMENPNCFYNVIELFTVTVIYWAIKYLNIFCHHTKCIFCCFSTTTQFVIECSYLELVYRRPSSNSLIVEKPHYQQSNMGKGSLDFHHGVVSMVLEYLTAI